MLIPQKSGSKHVSPDQLKKTNRYGATLAERAVRRGLIAGIKPYLTRSDLEDWSLFRSLFERGELHHVIDLMSIELVVRQEMLEDFPPFWDGDLQPAQPDLTPLFSAENICIEGHDGRAPIHLLAKDGKLSLVAHLLRKEHLSIRDNKGQGTATLHYLAPHGFSFITHLLSPDMLGIRNSSGSTVCHLAAQYWTLQELSHLLSPKMLWEKDENGASVVHVAAESGHLELILPIIANESDSKSAVHDRLIEEDHYGRTVAHCAAMGGNLPDLLPWLDPEDLCLEDKDGRTPIAHFIQWELMEAGELAANYGALGDAPGFARRAVMRKLSHCSDEVKALVWAYLLAA